MGQYLNPLLLNANPYPNLDINVTSNDPQNTSRPTPQSGPNNLISPIAWFRYPNRSSYYITTHSSLIPLGPKIQALDDDLSSLSSQQYTIALLISFRIEK